MLARDQSEEAKTILVRSWTLNRGKEKTVDKAVLLNLAGLALARKQDPRPYFARIKTLLATGLLRVYWPFELLYEWVQGYVESVQVKRLSLVGEAIRDEAKLPALESEPWWRDIDPIALDEPLPGAD